MPLAALEDEHALIAYEADGEPLTPEHGWPLGSWSRAATSGRAPSGCEASSCVPSDEPGFWERYGYHNDADYWKEERYEF